MQYQQPSFTLPVTTRQMSQKDWDRATMSREDFAKKYGRQSAPSNDGDQNGNQQH